MRENVSSKTSVTFSNGSNNNSENSYNAFLDRFLDSFHFQSDLKLNRPENYYGVSQKKYKRLSGYCEGTMDSKSFIFGLWHK